MKDVREKFIFEEKKSQKNDNIGRFILKVAAFDQNMVVKSKLEKNTYF